MRYVFITWFAVIGFAADAFADSIPDTTFAINGARHSAQAQHNDQEAMRNWKFYYRVDGMRHRKCGRSRAPTVTQRMGSALPPGHEESVWLGALQIALDENNKKVAERLLRFAGQRDVVQGHRFFLKIRELLNHDDYSALAVWAIGGRPFLKQELRRIALTEEHPARDAAREYIRRHPF